MSAKLATLGLLKTKIIRNKGYHVIIPDYDITIKIYCRCCRCCHVTKVW